MSRKAMTKSKNRSAVSSRKARVFRERRTRWAESTGGCRPGKAWPNSLCALVFSLHLYLDRWAIG